jgi:hypothetical protein
MSGECRAAEIVDVVTADGVAVLPKVSAVARPVPAAAPLMNTALLVPMNWQPSVPK